MPNPQSAPSDPSLTECREFDIRITSDGTWHYQNSPIGRPALVRLFARALKRDEAGDYWLETPVERGRIQVDDAPFLVTDLGIADSGPAQRLEFRTNLDHVVTADAAHPILMRPVRAAESSRSARPGLGPRPYLVLHDRIEALIARPVYYRLVELAVEHEIDGVPTLGVWSAGAFFPLFSDADGAWPGAGSP